MTDDSFKNQDEKQNLRDILIKCDMISVVLICIISRT